MGTNEIEAITKATRCLNLCSSILLSKNVDEVGGCVNALEILAKCEPGILSAFQESPSNAVSTKLVNDLVDAVNGFCQKASEHPSEIARWEDVVSRVQGWMKWLPNSERTPRNCGRSQEEPKRAGEYRTGEEQARTARKRDAVLSHWKNKFVNQSKYKNAEGVGTVKADGDGFIWRGSIRGLTEWLTEESENGEVLAPTRERNGQREFQWAVIDGVFLVKGKPISRKQLNRANKR